MSSNGCLDFRAHPLRPDKCRNCFADAARHQTMRQAPGNKTNNAPNPPRPASEATSESERPNSKSEDRFNDNPSGQAASSEFGLLASMSREELIRELRMLREEKANLLPGSQVIATEKPEDQLKAPNGFEEGSTKDDNKPTVIQCATCNRLSAELEELRAKCKSASDERDAVREELRALEKEMEEMHDNFKEEESEQFEQLKQELDLALKNCKILQIRLGKSERQYGQLEQVKSMLERQLSEESVSRGNANNDSGRQVVAENSSQIGDSFGQSSGNSRVSFVQLGQEMVKLSTSEYDQLLRDLNDTIERERDLQEQIKYSQEETQMKSDKLQAIEAENELLTSKVGKLTMANARLKSMLGSQTRKNQLAEAGQSMDGDQIADEIARVGSQADDLCKLIEQNEQLKLALELAQNESQRLRNKLQETNGQLELREGSLKEVEVKNCKLEEELLRLGCQLEQSRQQVSGGADQLETSGGSCKSEQVAKLELECRQLRARLVHSERDCKQLKAQLEMSAGGRQSRTGEHSGDTSATTTTSSSIAIGEQAKSREINRQLREQCDSLRAQNLNLERRLERLSTEQNVGDTIMESDLLDKLKKQLEVSESELVKSRSRLVELDLECSRAQRQYKRLVSSLESSQANELGNAAARRVRLPVSESMRDSLSRQELRQAIKELEEELEESLATVRSKDCLIKELRLVNVEQQSGNSTAERMSSAPQQLQVAGSDSNRTKSEEQLKSLRRLLDQERLLSNNLKLDVRNLEQSRLELMTNNRMLERERVSMEEELDKLRELNNELNLNLEEAKQAQRVASNRLVELQVDCEKLRNELSASSRDRERSLGPSKLDGSRRSDSLEDEHQASGDLLLMARDLSELKVKNGFLMRQLEIAHEETGRQLEDLRTACEAQQRRAVEMAQLEVKERQLTETQQLREELNEAKQKLAASQRLATRNEEAVSSERDRIRSAEREWRREKSHWQQRVEQLEAQLALERRSNEFKSKEIEAQVRDKERELISVQDRCVQVERDLKRLQNKHSLLEENSEQKQKNLERDLEAKKRELSELVASKQSREQEFYENCKRFNGEKSTLLEALESIRSSYEEKQTELRRIRELLVLRQDQAYKERLGAQERIDGLGRELIRLAEYESRAKLLKQQVEVNERQLESARRDLVQLKEEKTRLRQRCEELERRCANYEKQELVAKTSSISASSTSASFLRTKLSFGSPISASSGKQRSSAESQNGAKPSEQTDNKRSNLDQGGEMVERLSGKINDQRHLINMLKQQYEEAQLELKQLKLIQASERSRLQSQLAQVTGQLNESEERLLFETSLVVGQDLFESSRRKLESKWTEERRNTLETLKQVQAQNDLLVRDMKKLSQSHDMLRLQSKQLEGHNNKLSRKLIEYQQQFAAVGSRMAPKSSSDEVSEQLEACLSDRRALLEREALLEHRNKDLARVLRDQVRPIACTLNKMLAALDGAGSSSKQTTGGANSSQSSLLEETRSNSTNRPLVAPSPVPSSRLSPGDPDSISSGCPAHQLAAASQQQSRLSRLFQSGTKSRTGQEQVDELAKQEAAKPATKTTKAVKRVKIKSAALGISASEKRELKQQLQRLDEDLNKLDELAGSDTSSRPLEQLSTGRAGQVSGLRASSADRDPSWSQASSSARSRSQRASSYAPHSSLATANSTGDSSPHSRVVHWRDGSSGAPDCSDLDSERSSWSTSQLERADLYKRFPQSSPASYLAGASLTDCESDCSLASELSSSYSALAPAGGNLSGRRFLSSGAESDGCIGAAGQQRTKSKGLGGKRAGLKTRLTSTLRNISRSITGLASDSEAETSGSTGLLGRRKLAAGTGSKSSQREEEPAGASKLREIRV